MAEWLMRGTVNTFFSGSNPLDTFYFIASFPRVSTLPPPPVTLPRTDTVRVGRVREGGGGGGGELTICTK